MPCELDQRCLGQARDEPDETPLAPATLMDTLVYELLGSVSIPDKRLITRSQKVSKPRDLYLESPDRSEI